MAETDFMPLLLQQGPTIAALAGAVIVLWRHIVSQDREHKADVKVLNESQKTEMTKLNAEYRDEIRTITGNFTSAIDRIDKSLDNNSRIMMEYNTIHKGLSENLYSNLVLSAQGKVKEPKPAK